MSNIWYAKLDNRYECRVQRTSPTTGVLTVRDTENNQFSGYLVNRSVTLSYGSALGPDVNDVAEWQRECLQAVEKAK